MSAAQHTCAPDRLKFVLMVAILASALGFIDGSIVAIAVPQMRQSLSASFIEIQWVSNAYMLFLSALMLIGGAFGDQFGTRRVFGVGILIFVLASQICAFAPDVEWLIAARALQGVGAAIMVPGSMALIARNFPANQRGRAMGLWVAASAITTSLGPLLGAFILHMGDGDAWRWIFLLNLPIGVIALFILYRFVPDDMPVRKQSLDLVGAFLFTLALGSLAWGLTVLGEQQGSFLAISVLLLGVVFAVLAIFWEKRIEAPMVDLALFKSRSFSGANVLTFLVWSGLGALFFYLPMVLITGWKLSTFHAGGIFIPFSILIAGVSVVVGRVVDRWGSRLFLVWGPVLSALGYIYMAIALLSQAFWFGIVPAMIILGFAVGLTASPLSTAVMKSVDAGKVGTASGINNMVARMSNLLAIAGLGAVLSLIYGWFIGASSLPRDIQLMMIEKGFGERLTGPLYQISTVELQQNAMSVALASLCAIVALCCVCGGLVGWFTQEDS